MGILICYTKGMISPAQPYIAGSVEHHSKNRIILDTEVPGNMETVIFQAGVLERCTLYFLCKCSTKVKNAVWPVGYSDDMRFH